MDAIRAVTELPETVAPAGSGYSGLRLFVNGLRDNNRRYPVIAILLFLNLNRSCQTAENFDE